MTTHPSRCPVLGDDDIAVAVARMQERQAFFAQSHQELKEEFKLVKEELRSQRGKLEHMDSNLQMMQQDIRTMLENGHGPKPNGAGRVTRRDLAVGGTAGTILAVIGAVGKALGWW